jgi:8-oxo-dGTP diphosphatase
MIAIKDEIHTLARAVIIQEDHILLAYDPRPNPNHYYELNVPFYYLPGGHINFKEPATQAVVRELSVEIGYTAEVERFLGIFEYAWSFPGDEVCCHTHEVNLIFKVYIPRIDRYNTIPQKEAHVAFKWIPINELTKVDLRPSSLTELILRWLKDDSSHAFKSLIV